MNISCMIDCNCVILSMHFRYILLLFVVCFHLFTANGKNNATITLHLWKIVSIIMIQSVCQLQS